MRVRLTKDESGFTLIELIITVTFVTIALVAIVEAFITVDKLNRQARNLAIATQLAGRQVEAARNLGFEAIPASQSFTAELPDNFGAPKSGSAEFVDLSPAEPGLKRLNVVIYYHEGGIRKDVQLSTLITERGINR
ncbi:type II secretion system GspH family protein [Candidatus Parcubacteria bacterium]|nr:type II secretion system GspH family protein [Candidatus Parcubacteria bacterium]